MTTSRSAAPAAVRAAATIAFVAVGLVVLTAWSATAAPVELTAAVCPEAPPGVQAFADQVTAWVKWGVLALIGIAAIVSLGSVLVGRMFSHPQAPLRGDGHRGRRDGGHHLHGHPGHSRIDHR